MLGIFFPLVALIIFLRYMKERYDCLSADLNKRWEELYTQKLEQLYKEECDKWKDEFVNEELEEEIRNRLDNDREYYLYWKNYVIDHIGDGGDLIMYRIGAKDLLLKMLMAEKGYIPKEDLEHSFTIRPINLNVKDYFVSACGMYYVCSRLIENHNPEVKLEYLPDNSTLNDPKRHYLGAYRIVDTQYSNSPVKYPGKLYWTKTKNLSQLMEKAIDYANKNA